MTSLPTRLPGIGPALRSVAAQERRPDRLVLSLPQRSEREGLGYELPRELLEVLEEHPWMEVHWVDKDEGPGTKLLGALHWLQAAIGKVQEDDVLMVLDDDHVYLPHAVGELHQQQLARGAGYACSYFAYFLRGIMVPQGADIISFQLRGGLADDVLEYHRAFVAGDRACFLVDDLWIAMFMRLSGRQVVSLRDLVTQRGLDMIYKRTENAKVSALEALGGEDRRDRVTLRAFDGLMSRLLGAGPQGLARWGAGDAVKRLEQTHMEVLHAERRIEDLRAWVARERGDRDGDVSGIVQRAEQELSKLLQLYRMQVFSAPRGKG